jgi:hypothetical protein
MSSGHIFKVDKTRLTILYIVAIRILVIENCGDMCVVVKGLQLATSVKSPNGFYLELTFSRIEI